MYTFCGSVDDMTDPKLLSADPGDTIFIKSEDCLRIFINGQWVEVTHETDEIKLTSALQENQMLKEKIQALEKINKILEMSIEELEGKNK